MCILADGSRELRDALESDYSDAFKAFYGVRPRRDLSNQSDAELHEETRSLYDSVELRNQPAPTSGEGWALWPAF